MINSGKKVPRYTLTGPPAILDGINIYAVCDNLVPTLAGASKFTIISDDSEIKGGVLINSEIISSHINGGTVDTALIVDSCINGGNIDSTDIFGSTVNGGIFSNSKIHDSIISGGNIVVSAIYECFIKGGDLRSAVLYYTWLSGGDVRGVHMYGGAYNDFTYSGVTSEIFSRYVGIVMDHELFNDGLYVHHVPPMVIMGG